MASLHGFDAKQVEPALDFGPVPAGTYLAMIIESIMKPNKAGTGKYLQLVFQILEGPCRGRRLFARLNLENPSRMAVQIARAELSALCRAVGVMAPADSAELHQLPLQIYVALKVREDTSELGNEIKGYAAKDAPPPAGTNGAPF